MTPQQIIFLSIVGIALVALIFLSESQKRYNLDSIKRKTVGDGQYGTARWATQEEIQSSTIQVPYEPEVWRYNEESRPTTTGIVVNLTQNKKQILATIDPSDSHTLLSSILTSRPPKPACLHSCSFMSITVPVFSI